MKQESVCIVWNALIYVYHLLLLAHHTQPQPFRMSILGTYCFWEPHRCYSYPRYVSVEIFLLLLLGVVLFVFCLFVLGGHTHIHTCIILCSVKFVILGKIQIFTWLLYEHLSSSCFHDRWGNLVVIYTYSAFFVFIGNQLYI